MIINFGYCCISTLNKELRCNSISTKTYLDKHSYEHCREYLKSKADQNIYNLSILLEKNNENNIKAFRLPEQLLPQLDLGYYSLDEYTTKLADIGKTANKYGMQLSRHPSHYLVLNSLRESVVENTITSLNRFAEMFEMMELDIIPNMTLHIGVKSQYDTTMDALDAFCRNFEKLNQSAKNLIVVENDQNSFTVDDCLIIHNKIGIPCVFDNRHYHWNNGELTFDSAVSKCTETWGIRTPKLHLSSENELTIHAHSDYIELCDYLELENALKKCKRKEYNVMLECKEKDKALKKLRHQIKKLNMKD